MTVCCRCADNKTRIHFLAVNVLSHDPTPAVVESPCDSIPREQLPVEKEHSPIMDAGEDSQNGVCARVSE